MQHISAIEEWTALETVPVLKTVYYPWTDDSFRPLAYGRLALFRGQDLLVDLMAFERDPVGGNRSVPDNSCVAITLDFGQGSVVTVALNKNGNYACFLNGQAVSPALEVSTYGGDDEQGWYWAVRFLLTEKILKDCFSVPKPEIGHTIKGNIFKFQRTGKAAHFGSIAPMVNDDIFSELNLTEFQFVHY